MRRDRKGIFDRGHRLGVVGPVGLNGCCSGAGNLALKTLLFQRALLNTILNMYGYVKGNDALGLVRVRGVIRDPDQKHARDTVRATTLSFPISCVLS